jgi:hypothetical protein
MNSDFMNKPIVSKRVLVHASILPAALAMLALMFLCGCRGGDGATPKPSKAEVISMKVNELYELGYGLVRIDRLNVEGAAVTGAALGQNAADNVGQQATDLGFNYGTLYVNKLREIRKFPRSSVEAAVDARYAANPSAPANRLVYSTLKLHLSSAFAGLNLDPADVVQDYASVRYMQ